MDKIDPVLNICQWQKYVNFVLAPGVPPFCSKNYNETFQVTVDQSCNLDWSNFSPFLLTHKHPRAEAVSVSSLQVPSQHLKNVLSHSHFF